MMKKKTLSKCVHRFCFRIILKACIKHVFQENVNINHHKNKQHITHLSTLNPQTDNDNNKNKNDTNTYHEPFGESWLLRFTSTLTCSGER